jgi:hypothetical protein
MPILREGVKLSVGVGAANLERAAARDSGRFRPIR